MMTFDYGGDEEPRENAQLGLHHHPRVVHPPLKRRRGQLGCLTQRGGGDAEPPDAKLTRTATVTANSVTSLRSQRDEVFLT